MKYHSQPTSVEDPEEGYPADIVEKVAAGICASKQSEHVHDFDHCGRADEFRGYAVAALDALGLTVVYRIAWDGEPSMSGKPHVASIGARFTRREDAERALGNIPRFQSRPGIRIEQHYETDWEVAEDD